MLQGADVPSALPSVASVGDVLVFQEVPSVAHVDESTCSSPSRRPAATRCRRRRVRGAEGDGGERWEEEALPKGSPSAITSTSDVTGRPWRFFRSSAEGRGGHGVIETGADAP